MPPRDFSEDGAVGAGSNVQQPQAGSQTGGFTQSDFGMAGGFGAGSVPTASPRAPSAPTVSAAGVPRAGVPGAGPVPLRAVTPFMFAGGGAIPDDDNDYDGNGSPAQELMQKALSTIDGVLAFGRRLHGLGGGDNEGIQTAQDDEAGSAGSPGQKRFQDGSMSPNIEDRRGESPPGAVGGAVSNFVGKAYDLYDRAANPDNPIDQSNPIAKDLGGDDLSQPPGGAIDTDEDE